MAEAPSPAASGSFGDRALAAGFPKVSSLGIQFVCANLEGVGEVGNLPRYGAKMVRNATRARRPGVREDPRRDPNAA